jgi:hypothetical protein
LKRLKNKIQEYEKPMSKGDKLELIQNIQQENGNPNILLESFNVGNRGAQIMANIIQSSSSLFELVLIRTEIGPEGGELIGKALSENHSLMVLNLGDQKNSPSLFTRTFYSSSAWNQWNRISDKGIISISNSLKLNRGLKLTGLFLCHQEASKEAFEKLANEGLGNYKGMEELDISFNPSISSIEIYKKLKKKIRITE